MVDFDIAEDGDPQPPEAHDHSGDSLSPVEVDAGGYLKNGSPLEIPPDLRATISELRTNLGETRFDLGLERLGYDDGWYDIFQNQDYVQTVTDLTAFDGSISPDGVQAGSFVSTTNDFGFVPAEVVVSHDLSNADSPSVFNGASFSYDNSEIGVGGVTLAFTGVEKTRDNTDNNAGLSDEDTTPLDVQGTEPVAVDVTLTGSGYAGGSLDSISETPSLSGYAKTAWSPDGSLFGAQAEGGGTVTLWETNTWSEIPESPLDPNAVNVSDFYSGIDWTSDGYLVVTRGDNDGFAVFDTSDWTEVADSPIGGISIQNIEANPTKGEVITQTAYTNPRLYETGTWDRKNVGFDFYEQPYGIRYSNDGSLLATSEEGFNQMVYDTSDYSIVVDTGDWAQERIEFITWSKDGDYLAFEEFSVGVKVVDTSDWSVTATLSEGIPEFSPVYGYLSILTDSNVLMYDTSDFTQTADSPVYSNTGYRQTWSPNNYYFALPNDEILDGGGPSSEDPAVAINGQSVSYNGQLLPGETTTATLNDPPFSPGGYTGDVSLTSGVVDVAFDWTDIIQSAAPNLTIDSDAGSQTITGNDLADGESQDLSSDVDTSLIGGAVTATVGVAESFDETEAEVQVEYAHTGVDAGGFVEYVIEDGNGNTTRVPVDVATTTDALDDSTLQINAELNNALGAVTLADYAVYLT